MHGMREEPLKRRSKLTLDSAWFSIAQLCTGDFDLAWDVYAVGAGGKVFAVDIHKNRSANKSVVSDSLLINDVNA